MERIKSEPVQINNEIRKNNKNRSEQVLECENAAFFVYKSIWSDKLSGEGNLKMMKALSVSSYQKRPLNIFKRP